MTVENVSLLYDIIDRLGLPLLLLLFLGLIIWRLMPSIREWIAAKTEHQRVFTNQQGEHNELVRHNSAVIENNTAALALLAHDRDALEQKIDEHSRHVTESFGRVEGTLDAVESKLDKVITDQQVIKALGDRSGHGRRQEDK